MQIQTFLKGPTKNGAKIYKNPKKNLKNPYIVKTKNPFRK